MLSVLIVFPVLSLGMLVGRLYKSGKAEEAMASFSALVDQCTDNSAVRLGDVLGVLVTYHAHHAHWKQVCHIQQSIAEVIVSCL